MGPRHKIEFARHKHDGSVATAKMASMPGERPASLVSRARLQRSEWSQFSCDLLCRLLDKRAELKTVKDELYRKTCEEYPGYPSDNIGSGLPQETDERVRGPHRDVGGDQT